MKAVVYQAPFSIAAKNVPDPELQHPNDGIVKITSSKMAFTLTWPRAVAPVRRGGLPAPSSRRESGRMAPVVSTDCRLSSSTGRYVGYVHCAPSASRPKAVKDAEC